MPIAEIDLEDGRTIELEVPEGSTQGQIMQYLSSAEGQQAIASFEPPQQEVEDRGFLDTALDYAKEVLKRRLKDGSMTREQAIEQMANFRAMSAPETPAEEPQQEQGFMSQALGAFQDYGSNLLRSNPLTAFTVQAIEGYDEMMSRELKTPEGEEPTFSQRVRDVMTGALRTTPEIEALPDWAEMPEMSLETLQTGQGMESFMTALGTMQGSPDEMAQVIKTQFPNTEVRQDKKGNFILKSSMDGKEYAIKPGFRQSDIWRAIPQVLLSARGGRWASQGLGKLGMRPGMLRTGAAEGVTQLGLEGVQSLAGGRVDLDEVALAAGGGAAFDLLKPGARGAMETAEVAAEPSPAAVAAGAEGLQDVAQQAAKGKRGAIEELASEVDADPETIGAAERLGFVDYLQPDHVSTNTAFVELQQLAKSQPGSQMRAAERAGLNDLGADAVKIVEDFGGTQDVGGLSSKIKSGMEATMEKVKSKESQLHNRVRNAISSKEEVSADQAIALLEEKIDEIGLDNLSSIEKKVYNMLTDPKSSSGSLNYAILDNARQEAGSVADSFGLVGSKESGEAKQLYKMLTEDQEAAVVSIGDEKVLRDWENAKAVTRAKHGLNDDMKSLFGKKMDGSIFNTLSSTVKKLEKTDVDPFINALKSIPVKDRQEYVASGVLQSFGKATKNGDLNFNTFSNWWNGLNKSERAKTALFKNLPPEARQAITDLGQISNSVNKAIQERVYSGKSLTQILQPAESFFKKAVKLMPRIAAAEGAGSMITPGIGTTAVLVSAIKDAKKDLTQDFLQVLSSPEFKGAVVASIRDAAAQERAAKRLARSKMFEKFWKATGRPNDLTARERWILSAFRTQEALDEEGREE